MQATRDLKKELNLKVIQEKISRQKIKGTLGKSLKARSPPRQRAY